ncbi:protein PHLOEM PROTEIN 2-LIKE A8 isoform X3 [Brassica napus]|uniref:protein PHLOEM PROTEIN 2-LIKE A8 isoform X3 n=1 Tax=Brassica napus TaxID=3708 RepID=UPI000BBE6F52|nr:protein PHLOEM PROTEIN 2-LIKE A8 isoform X3 [Brassica napus]
MENTNYINDQVFISFRGKDERCGFLTYLKQRLLESNVNVFIDENAAGEPLENLFGHIRKSRIAIVIVSKNYAESSWCLDELVEIKKCMETEKLNAVIPIFRKVKVSSVRKQSGKFGERIKRWKKALEFVTGMIGLTYDKKFSRSEFEFVGKVVEKVHKTLGKTAAKAGRNSTPETSKKSQEKLSYLFVFNINHSNVNGLIHSSRTLEALTLNLDRLNPERSTGSLSLSLFLSVFVLFYHQLLITRLMLQPAEC